MSCPDCFSGTVHEGTPTGREEKIHGLDTYVSDPPQGSNPKGVVVIIPDAFGWKFNNTRVMADSMAKKGNMKVLVPEFMGGNAAPLSLLDAMPKMAYPKGMYGQLIRPYYTATTLSSFIPFLYRNRMGVIMPPMQSYLQSLRKETTLPIGAAGYCWGGKFAVNLANGNFVPGGKPLVDVVYTAHPSNLEIPKEIDAITLPFSMAIGSADFVLNMAGTNKIKEALEKRKELDSEVKVYDGAKHGFAIRGDPGDEKEAKQGLEAEDQAVAWFSKHFDRFGK